MFFKERTALKQKLTKGGNDIVKNEKFSGFAELSHEEQEGIDGGGWPLLIGLGALALGAVATFKGCADADHGK